MPERRFRPNADLCRPDEIFVGPDSPWTQNPIVAGRHLVADSDRAAHLNWAWPMLDIERFDVPIPARGAQGFWHWNPTDG